MGFLDIYHQAKANPGFGSQVQAISKELQMLERRTPTTKVLEQRQLLMLDFLKVCDFNSGFLVPYFFPKYPGNKPLSLLKRPFAFAFYAMVVGGYMVFRGSRQISKSTSLAGRQLIHAQILPKWQSMHVVPHTDHRNTYATRLREMELAGRFYKKRHDLRQNLYLKEFETGSKIELVRALTTAAHIRGKTTYELLYDEYQLFDVSLEGEIDQTIKSSPAKVRIYSGTSTTVDSPLEDRFEKSSQGFWFVKGSKGYINFGDEEQVKKMIRPDGLRDPWDSSRTVDILSGQWVHKESQRLEMNRIGFHVPQLIIPDFVYDIEQWADIYNAFVEYDWKLFCQEVLGIPVEEGHRELTKQDLERICVLRHPDDVNRSAREYCKRKAANGGYRLVVSGFDWGGSDAAADNSVKTSYTTHVMIAVDHDGSFHIIHMKRYMGMAYDQIVKEILHDHFELGGMAIASDAGGGSVYNQVVRQDPRVAVDRHLVMAYTASNTAMFAEAKTPNAVVNQWSLNKTESLTSLFQAIRSPEMKVRCYEWEMAKDYLLEFLNSYRVITESSQGRKYFRYLRPPSKADDTLHATNYAFTLAKLMMGEPLIQDPGVARVLAQRLQSRITVAGNLHPGPGVFSGRVIAG